MRQDYPKLIETVIATQQAQAKIFDTLLVALQDKDLSQDDKDFMVEYASKAQDMANQAMANLQVKDIIGKKQDSISEEGNWYMRGEY